MRYSQLTDDQLAEIRRQKLLQIEAEHATLALDLQLADGVEMVNEQVAQGRANLSLLERQHADLLKLMAPPASPNGSSPTAVGSDTLTGAAPAVRAEP